MKQSVYLAVGPVTVDHLRTSSIAHGWVGVQTLFQYPLDFGADVTHDNYLTVAKIQKHTLIKNRPQKHQTNRLRNRRRSFKKRYLTNYKMVAKNYDRAAGCRIRLFPIRTYSLLESVNRI